MTVNPKEELKKCPSCNGKGEVDNWVMGLGNSPEECQICKGTGKIRIKRTGGNNE